MMCFFCFGGLISIIDNFVDISLLYRVPLANGGSLVIEQTEALVSIDVNGGHGMFGHETSQEKAILDVNLAASKQVSQMLNSYFHFICRYHIIHGQFNFALFCLCR